MRERIADIYVVTEFITVIKGKMEAKDDGADPGRCGLTHC